MDYEIGNIKYDEEFILNSRGVKLFTCSWIPQNKEPKALIFICHGYAMECSITMNSTAVRLVNAGFACYGIDYEGHGKSAGLTAYVNNFDDLVDDCSYYFTNICEKKENKEKMRYLLGESMGGAMVLFLQRKKPDYFDGAVLVAPMCKIAENVRPHPLVINVLTKLCKFIPTWKIVPGQDIIDVAFKETEKRKEIRANPYCYKGRPRLKTGYELLRISLDLEQRLEEVSIPFIVLHGEDDRVTDKAVSKQLYEVASSSDKTIKLYPGMWHGLLYGEPQENIEIVFADIVDWLNDRASMGNSRLEMELKQNNDNLISCK
ncbi:Caffeoylshikimate esterase-like [Melia azedarach]|uniref:Caffeoylshikimate esterase-like n=1 Tax=Melia azedarach TaxID=155640 RepID=A0ACC1Y7R0_MELAZ|nr:Caffeoylshikimate esterase-like [Melia azedarach]